MKYTTSGLSRNTFSLGIGSSSTTGGNKKKPLAIKIAPPASYNHQSNSARVAARVIAHN